MSKAVIWWRKEKPKAEFEVLREDGIKPLGGFHNRAHGLRKADIKVRDIQIQAFGYFCVAFETFGLTLLTMFNARRQKFFKRSPKSAKRPFLTMLSLWNISIKFKASCMYFVKNLCNAPKLLITRFIDNRNRRLNDGRCYRRPDKDKAHWNHVILKLIFTITISSKLKHSKSKVHNSSTSIQLT